LRWLVLLNGLFINVLLLISFTFIGGHITKEISKSTRDSVVGKLLLGIGGGFLGVLLMVYTIPVYETTTIVDLRHFAVLIISWFGGIIPIVVTSCIIAVYRITYAGLNISAVLAIIQIFVIAAALIVINKKVKREPKRWILKFFAAQVAVLLTLSYLLRNVEGVYLIILQYTVVSAIAGVIEYITLNYVQSSNDLYRMYKMDSTKDFLTGLNNTREFDKLLNISCERAVSNSEKLSCFMIDIDHFKKINDTYGHAIGDIVLKELAELLKTKCRSFDIIGRVGGEEFCVLLPDCPQSHAVDIGWKLRNAVKAHKIDVGNNINISITISIGVSTFPDTVTDLNYLREKADVALYTAKQSGRDKVCDYRE
jgi:diguanylate cyclase